MCNDGVIPFEKANIKDKVPNNWEKCGIMERVDIDKVVFLEQFTLVFKTIEVMNKERYEQIINEAYENYFNTFKDEWIKQYQSWLGEFNHSGRPISKDEFINKIKTDSEFSEKWGLTIEERELHSEERKTLHREHCMKNFWALKLHGTTLHYEHCMKDFWDLKITGMNEVDYEKANIPTRLITLTYNNETIITYEQ